MKRYRRDDEDLKLSVIVSLLEEDGWKVELSFKVGDESRTIEVIPHCGMPFPMHRNLKEILPTSDLKQSATMVEQALILAASEAVKLWSGKVERGSIEFNRLMSLQADACFDWWVSSEASVLLGESLRSRSPQKGRASS